MLANSITFGGAAGDSLIINSTTAFNAPVRFGTDISGNSATFCNYYGGDAALRNLAVTGPTACVDVVGRAATFCNYLGGDAALRNLAVTGPTACVDVAGRFASFCNYYGGDASFCNLTVSGALNLAGVTGVIAATPCNITCDTLTARGLISGQGNAVIKGDLTVQGRLIANIGADIGYLVNNNVIFEHTVTMLASLTVTSDVMFAKELTVAGDALFGSDVSAAGRVAATDALVVINSADPSRFSRWSIRTVPHADEPRLCDLEFVSWKQTAVAFTETFDAGLLNFTGSHRCSVEEGCGVDWAAHVGCIVASTGRYKDLDGAERLHVDEAVPVVELCTERESNRVFGVVAGVEDARQARRHFQLGNMRFAHDKRGHNKVIVNSVGEGGIWVCDANGPLRNGDLVCASGRACGSGMRQPDDIVRSKTVAKITCDCLFEPGEGRRFVGCIYMC